MEGSVVDVPRAATVAVLVAVGLAACSGSDGGGSDTGESDGGGEAATATVSLEDFAIDAPASVAAGTVVTVVNVGEAPHNWTAEDGAFSTADLASGEEEIVTLSEPGTYAFTCTIHPDQMTGTIDVTG